MNLNGYKKWTLTFPNGLVLEGFKWSLFGYFYLAFPDSGLRSEQYNSLKYTREGMAEAGITMEEE